MEGEKETAEEKEEEEEEKQLHPHVAVASPVDYQDLPIIHWEDLSQRIAELEKQEQERRERSKLVFVKQQQVVGSDSFKQEHVGTSRRGAEPVEQQGRSL